MTPRAPFLVLFFLLSLSAAAQLPRNEISLAAGWTDYADVGGARAAAGSYKHYWTPLFATEAGAIFAGSQVSASRKLDFTDVHLSAQFHPLREHIVSPWIGAGLAHVTFSDRESSGSNTTSVISGGFDVRLAPRLAIGAEVLHSSLVINPRDRFALRINPTTFLVALRWRS